ncbi:MAG: hypothetical protein IIY72_04980 [Solobacterium sp.]|nr:hypothetical protein [Solobacterium sp.]
MEDFKIYQASGMLTELVKDASDVRIKQKTITGNIAHFKIHAESPVKIIVDINTTGATSCKITKTGKNILENIMADGNLRGVDFAVNSDKTISASGQAIYNLDKPIYSKWPLTMLRGIHAFVSGIPENSPAGESIMLYYHNANNADVGNQNFYSDGGAMVIPESAIDASVTVNITRWTHVNNIISPQIEIGNHKTAYEEYKGISEIISWGDVAGSITAGTLTIEEDGSVTLETGGQTYTLTSISPIETYIGDNNIWSDAGEVSVTYQY